MGCRSKERTCIFLQERRRNCNIPADIINIGQSQDTVKSTASFFEAEIKPHLLSQRELNDIVRDLEFTKKILELQATA